MTKTQILNRAEAATSQTKAKNKRRLREGLSFRMIEDYSTWGELIGNCQPIGYKSVSHVSIKSIVNRALEESEETRPCVVIFRLGNQNFIYSKGGMPIIFNARLFIERGGCWRYTMNKDGTIQDWFIVDADADRTTEGEILLTEPVPYPRNMSDEWRMLCFEHYGHIYDKYHIIPDEDL